MQFTYSITPTGAIATWVCLIGACQRPRRRTSRALAPCKSFLLALRTIVGWVVTVELETCVPITARWVTFGTQRVMARKESSRSTGHSRDPGAVCSGAAPRGWTYIPRLALMNLNPVPVCLLTLGPGYKDRFGSGRGDGSGLSTMEIRWAVPI